jgi:chitinase
LVRQQRGLEALGGLPQAQQVDLLRGYAELSAAFKAQLARLQAEGRSVVTKADIAAFMAQFKAEQAELQQSRLAGLT